MENTYIPNTTLPLDLNDELDLVIEDNSNSEETFLRAKQMLGSCKTCICALTEFGPYNEKNRQLFEYAKKLGKI